MKKEWIDKYELAKKYYEQNGHLYIPQQYQTEEGINLGAWLGYQKSSYKKGTLNEEKIKLLEELDIKWDIGRGNSNSKNGNILSWNDRYNIALDYYKKNGTTNVPQNFILEDGFNLGKWINSQKQRIRYTEQNILDKKNYFLTDDQLKKLQNIEISGDKDSSYQTSFPEQTIYFYLTKFFKDVINRDISFGFELDIYIPSIKLAIEYDGQGYHNVNKRIKNDNLKNEKCKELGITLIRIRESKLPEISNCICFERKEITNEWLEKSIVFIFEYIKDNYNKNYLNALDIDINRDTKLIISLFKEYSNRIWDRYYKALEEYYLENGNVLVPYNFVTKDGLNLGNWIVHQRGMLKKPENYDSKLSQTQIDKLNEIEMVWDVRDYDWMNSYSLLEDYYLENNSIDMFSDCSQEDDYLAQWLNRQKEKYQKNELDEKYVKLLEKLNINWEILKKKDDNWDYGYSKAKEYFKEYEDLLCSKDYITPDGFALGSWLQVQRNGYNNIGKFVCPTQEHIDKLNEINMCWDGLIPGRWRKFLKELEFYVNNNENPFPISRLYLQKKYELGHNLLNCFNNYKKNKLTEDEINSIEKIVGKFENISFLSLADSKRQLIDILDDSNFTSKSDVNWINNFNEVKELLINNKKIEDKSLYLWYLRQLKLYKNNELKDFQKVRIQSILEKE